MTFALISNFYLGIWLQKSVLQVWRLSKQIDNTAYGSGLRGIAFWVGGINLILLPICRSNCGKNQGVEPFQITVRVQVQLLLKKF